MGWNTITFEDSSGKDILGDFIKKLDKLTIAKISRLIRILKEKGPFLYMPYSKKITNKIYELRIRGKQEIRIFYTFKGKYIYLLHIFQNAPPRVKTRGCLLSKEFYLFN